MALPPLVFYATVSEYRSHYLNAYCRAKIQTFDGIRVYFSPDRFGHAFYESTSRDGFKDAFSQERAQRMDWIRATLESPDAVLFQGWDKKARQYDGTRRVAVVYEDFVVVVQMRIDKRDRLKANFVTCYQADNSIHRVGQSPNWSYTDCLQKLSRSRGQGR
ncbi:MAG: hypothetical protein JXK94_06130 [Deltaproteobacteria bacterium]|nr:hypothetical protein [Deltaproteobacteria bacterium]